MLIEKIQKDLVEALKSKSGLVVSTLRLLLSEIHNREIEKQAKVTDEDVMAVIRKEVKQRQEAIEAYEKGGRQDLADKEKQESEILSNYLPQEMSTTELEKITKEVINEVGASGPGDFGKVMGVVMGRVKGRIDGAKVAEAVKKLI
ncbi:GatB/YqeY domain-containing protein [Patescibacteria group bacterium]|nr:GatB/YqeY domain-containing protein [Patescibacteria group bacterium]